ncbi:unnamed protein product [Diamesa tonsa]
MLQQQQKTLYFSIIFRLLLSSTYCYAAGSTTELVEEWGCYDTEFRLTCNHLDSKLAFLEASFLPNCENSNSNNCLYYDENSLTKIISRSTRLGIEEEEAGRRFLDILRKAHRKEKEQEENEARTSEYRTELWNSTDVQYDLTSNNNTENNSSGEIDETLHSDKKVLRNNLEKLISLYLTKLREDNINDEEEEFNHIRNRREVFQNNDKKQHRTKLEKSDCKQLRRRISSLDRFEIEKSLQNYTNTQFNIRKLLNYRCSGKNHCSFIFGNDHPYALFWTSGVVHIKYICIDEFRTNKYCGERITIGNEQPEMKIKHTSEFDDDESEEFREPVAEARTHLEHYHQFTNLKIIKTEKSEMNNSLPRAAKADTDRTLEKDKTRSKMFSQDFRFLKIFPNTIEEIKVNESVKQEYVFKNEQLTTSNGIDSNELGSIMSTINEPTINEAINEPTISEPTNEPVLIANKSHSTNGFITIVERKDLENTVIHPPPHELSHDNNEDKPIDVTVLTNDIDSLSESAKYQNFTNHGTLKGSVLEPFHINEDDEEEDMDSSTEEPTTVNAVTPKYFSEQKSLTSRTLQHGFIMNPGYPKFYIGQSSDCKWRIYLEQGQRMVLTILDLSIRYDDFCKDYLEIADVGARKVSLYRGCSEISRPISILSGSHVVEITLKTKSRIAYPKRGFLIHYKTLGCLIPVIPSAVELVKKTESFAVFSCWKGHVFPDTSESDRVLGCLAREEIWNNTLPNCISIEQTLGSGLVLHLGEHLRKERNMSANSADMFYDVIVPSAVVAVLFFINFIVFSIIMRYRKKLVQQRSLDRELAEL